MNGPKDITVKSTSGGTRTPDAEVSPAKNSESRDAAMQTLLNADGWQAERPPPRIVSEIQNDSRHIAAVRAYGEERAVRLANGSANFEFGLSTDPNAPMAKYCARLIKQSVLTQAWESHGKLDLAQLKAQFDEAIATIQTWCMDHLAITIPTTIPAALALFYAQGGSASLSQKFFADHLRVRAGIGLENHFRVTRLSVQSLYQFSKDQRLAASMGFDPRNHLAVGDLTYVCHTHGATLAVSLGYDEKAAPSRICGPFVEPTRSGWRIGVGLVMGF